MVETLVIAITNRSPPGHSPVEPRGMIGQAEIGDEKRKGPESMATLQSGKQTNIDPVERSGILSPKQHHDLGLRPNHPLPPYLSDTEDNAVKRPACRSYVYLLCAYSDHTGRNGV